MSYFTEQVTDVHTERGPAGSIMASLNSEGQSCGRGDAATAAMLGELTQEGSERLDFRKQAVLTVILMTCSLAVWFLGFVTALWTSCYHEGLSIVRSFRISLQHLLENSTNPPYQLPVYEYKTFHHILNICGLFFCFYSQCLE